MATPHRVSSLALAFALALPGLARAEPEPAGVLPNVVFILADDLGFTDLPAYRRALGLAVPIETPHIDRLAAEGMLFLDAHQPAAVCAPARFATLTGSQHLRGRAAWSMRSPSAFDLDGRTRHRTVGETLQAAGYRTAFVGKEHLGGRGLDATGEPTGDFDALDFSATVEVEVVRGDGRREMRRLARPRGLVAHGFDDTYTLSSGPSAPPYVYWENDRFRPIGGDGADAGHIRAFVAFEEVDRGNGAARIPQTGPGDVDWDPSDAGPRLAEAAVGFIEQHLRERPEVPFLLFYASTAVHPTAAPPNDFAGTPVRGAAGVPSRRADLVLQLDLEVGRILGALADNGAAEDTLVFLSSDNGGLASDPAARLAGYESTGSLRGHKGSPFEGGHRVPLIVRWGDGTPEGSRVPPARTTRQLVAITDWVASLYDLTGQTLPHDQVYDGASLLPLLFSGTPDAEPPVRRYHLVAQRGRGVRFDQPVEAGTHSWYYFEGDEEHFSGRRFLFDLSADPEQRQDLLAGLPNPLALSGLDGLARYRALALLPRVVGLRNWLRSRSGPDDLPTTPRVDYARPENRTPVPRMAPRDGAG